MHATSNHPVESAHERHHSSQSKLFTYAFDKTCTAPALLPVRWCQNHVQNQVQSFLLPWGMAMCTSACPVDVGHIQDAGNVRGALGSTNPKNVEIYLVSKFVLPALPLHVPSVDRQSSVPSPSPPPPLRGSAFTYALAQATYSGAERQSNVTARKWIPDSHTPTLKRGRLSALVFLIW